MSNAAGSVCVCFNDFASCPRCVGADVKPTTDVFRAVLQKKGALPEHCVAVVLFEVLKVVAACHRRSVFHGDIKVRCFR